MPLKGQVRHFNINYIVLALAANKCDLFLEEEVKTEDSEKYANEIGAFYKRTSASTNAGITQLFTELGKKFLDPNYQMRRETLAQRPKTIKLNNQKIKDKSRKCC